MRETDQSETPPPQALHEAGARAVKNTAMLMLLRFVVPLLSLVLVFTLSRFLGAQGLGRYTLVFSFLTLLGGLGPLGLATVITRDGAGDPARLSALLRNAMTLCTGASILLSLLMIAAGPLLDYDAETRRDLLILSLALTPYAIGMLLDGAIVALERMQYMAAATVAEYVLKVAVAVVLLLLGFDLDAVLLAAVAGRLLGCIVAARLLNRAGVRVGWSAEREVLSQLGRLAPTFLLTTVFATIYWRIDVLMLSKLAAFEDVGYYGAAYRLFEIGMVVPQSLCLAVYPQMAAAVRSNLQQLEVIGRNALRYLLAISLPTAVFVALAARPLLGLLYGAEFETAAPTLAVLVWTLIPLSLVRYHAYVLIAAGRQRIDLLLNVAMSVINVLLNLFLIPRYSHFGAACATLAALCILALLQRHYLQRHLPGHAAPVRIPVAVWSAAVLVGLCTWLLRDVSFLLVAVLAPLLYLAALLCAGFFTRTQLKFARLDRLLERARLAIGRHP